MISPVILTLLLLNGVGIHPQSGSTQAEIAKSSGESGFECERGRVMSIDGSTPVANAVIVVREVKRSFPHAHVTIVRLEKGNVVAKLGVNGEGYVDLSSLKPGDYFLDLSVPEGKASSMVTISAGARDKSCTVELRVARVENALILSTRKL